MVAAKPDNEPSVSVGLYTDGEPRISQSGKFHLLHNLQIGHGFHWQKCMEAILPGTIKILDKPTEEGVTLVNTIAAEEYLRCVAISEMSATAPVEFLKAHAVIARSWLMGKLRGNTASQISGRVSRPGLLIDWEDTSSHSGFDVCSDDHCQRYQGLQPLTPHAEEALESTRGIVLVDGSGNIADARYSKCCGGTTELFSTCWQDEDHGYLRSFKDPYCDLSQMSGQERDDLLATMLRDYDRNPEPFGTWKTRISKKEIAENLRRNFGRDLGDVTAVSVSERGLSGRASMLSINGTKGNLRLGKELMIRRLLSSSHLYSSLFTLDDCEDYVSITGRGWGHGVGMCQIGAARMAGDGACFREILSFYYPSTTLNRLYQ